MTCECNMTVAQNDDTAVKMLDDITKNIVISEPQKYVGKYREGLAVLRE